MKTALDDPSYELLDEDELDVEAQPHEHDGRTSSDTGEHMFETLAEHSIEAAPADHELEVLDERDTERHRRLRM
jgi:hypothetical protein